MFAILVHAHVQDALFQRTARIILGRKKTLQHHVLSRRDTQERRNKIVAARRIIYEQNYVVDTPQVESLLKEESLVPTKVWPYVSFMNINLTGT